MSSDADNGRTKAIIGLGLCLFISALSWMLMKMGSIWAEIDIGDNDGLEYWVIAAYIICEVGIIPLSGKLIDRFGEKRILLYGVSLFVVGATLCGFSQTMDFLVFSRCIQGLGAGIVFTVAFTSVGTLYRNNHRGSAHEVMTAAFAVGSLYGTMVGYWFVFNASWRNIFFVVAAMMVIAGVVAYRNLPEREGSKDYDIVGAVILSTLFFAVMIYSQLVNNKFYVISIQSLIALIVVICLAVMLYIVERKAIDPAFPIHMERVHAKCMLSMFLVCVCGIGLIQYMMKMFLLHFTLDIYEASAMFIFLLAGGAVTSIIGCRKVTRTGLRPWVAFGSVLLVIGFAMMAFFGDDSIYHMMMFLIVIGMGLGCMVTEILCAMQGISPRKDMGTYTANTMGLRMAGIAIGNVLFSYYIVSQINDFANNHGISFEGDAMDIINLIITLFSDMAAEATSVFNNAVFTCAAFAAVAFIFVGFVGLWIKKEDLEYAETLSDNKEE